MSLSPSKRNRALSVKRPGAAGSARRSVSSRRAPGATDDLPFPEERTDPAASTRRHDHFAARARERSLTSTSRFSAVPPAG